MKWACIGLALGLIGYGGYRQADQQKLIKGLTDKITTLEKGKKDLEKAQGDTADKLEVIDKAAATIFVSHEKRIEAIEGELKPH